MTAPTIGRATSRSANLLMLASLLIAFIATLAPMNGPPAAAQPLCLDGKIWSEEAQECGDLAEAQPVEDLPLEEPQPTEIPAPPEAIVPTDLPADDEEVQSSDAPAQIEVVDATDVPGESELRNGGAPAALSVTSFGCPANFDPNAVDQAGRRATCRSIHLAGNPEVFYSLTVDDVVNENNSLPPSTGVGRWRVVPAGDWAVSQTVPPGYTGPLTVFCGQSGASPGSGTTFSFSGDGGTFLLQAQPGSVWFCNSFLVEISTGGITAHVFGCPASLDIYSSEPEDLLFTCAPYLENIQFELEYSDLVSNSSTNTLGRTTFAKVNPGDYRLRAGIPEGYGPPVVFCTVTGPSGQTLENYDRFDVSNTASIGLGMDALENVACDFFMAPIGQSYEDPGFPPQGLVPGDNATPAAGEVGLQDPGFPVQGPGGTAVAGQPEQPGIPDEIPALGGLPPDDAGIQDPGMPAIDANGAIDIVAWSCPAGYDVSSKGPDDLIGDCGRKLDGVEFQLQHPASGISTQLTEGLRSTAYFRNIGPGQLTLREITPNKYGMPVVFCEVRGPQNQTIHQYDKYDVSNSASVQLGMNELNRFRCDFFQAQPGVRPVDDADDLSNPGISAEPAEPQATQAPDGSPIDGLGEEGGNDLLPVDPISEETGEESVPATPPAVPPG